MLSNGCLVTADPEFTGPQQTAPILLENDQRPLGQLIEFRPG